MGWSYLGHCLLGVAIPALFFAVTGLLLDGWAERLEAFAVAGATGAVGLGCIWLERRDGS